MRIISGKYKGMKLSSFNEKNIRPTSDRAKETLFNILHNLMDFESMKCLDLFCGSGALGLEMISRGADSCVFVDMNIDVAKKNAAYLSVDDKCEFERSDVLNYLLKVKSEFDVVFCDPPYDYESYDDIINGVSKCGLFLVLEHSAGFVLNDIYENYLYKRKKIGTVNFTLLDFNKN
ncbi:MAG TPA: 16S rRNA (guanine(966)-N(2))-methyltransferase RsmD [Ignavibacteria bacterium]|nr:16S rRNA (guanine(966)-N(2))-methyltransferase RsmD [Ignavibacteria bacterium]HRA99736.1 16S rRNA (guanine(966)-N(2))-methyltransferase RsmD [Ignavibacteria bacterium]